VLNRLRDVFASFQSHEVHYVVIGGIAAVLHGVPRATFDLDILIEATEPNVERLLRALREAGFGTADLIDAQGILANEITVFNDRVRIDVQTSTPGLTFEDAWNRRETMAYQGQEFHVASRHDVIASKRAAGRQKDLEDVRVLELGPEKPS
jgi:Nucleotidyltransferase of unknown function (DUF6036)